MRVIRVHQDGSRIGNDDDDDDVGGGGGGDSPDIADGGVKRIVHTCTICACIVKIL